MAQDLPVYQLALGVALPPDVAAQVVVDAADEDTPYTVTFHLRPDQLNLSDLLASGRATRIVDSAPPAGVLSETPARALRIS